MLPESSHMAGTEVGRISIKVTPDTSGFRRELSKKLKAIEQGLRVTIPADVDLDTAGVKARFKELMAGLRAEGAKGVNIETHLDRDLIGRGLSGQIGKLTQGFNDVDEAAGGASRTILGLSRVGWITAAVFAGAAPAVGLVAGLLAGIPSLLAGFAGGAGAIAAGLEGIKAAAATLTPQLESLKTTVSSVFETQLTPVFKQLGTIFPTLEAGLSQVAGGLVELARGFTNVVTSAGGIKLIENILANTTTMFSALRPVIEQSTQAFLTLASAGSSSFGLLTGVLERFATGFNEMVTRITSNGAFENAMGGLSKVLDSMLGLFTRLFEAGAEAMGQLGGPLATLINGLGDAFIAAMPALTTFSALIANVGGTLLSALAPAIKALTPAFNAFANTLGTILTNNLAALTPLLTQVAEAIGGALLQAVQAITPILPQLLQSFVQFATTLTTSLAPVLPQIAANFGQLLAALVPLTPLFLQLLTEAIIPMIPSLIQLMTASLPVATALAQMASAVAPLAQGFLTALGPILAIGGALGALISPISAVAAGFKSIAPAVREFVAAVVTAVGEVVASVTGLASQIVSILQGVVGQMASIGTAIMQGLANGIRAGIGLVKAAVEGLASLIPGWAKKILGVASPSKVFAEIGANITQGWAQGITSEKQAALRAVDDIGKGMTAAAKDSFDISEELKSAGSKALDAGFAFGKANLDQLRSDLGIGGGALTAGADALWEWGTQAVGNVFNFSVSNIDEAIAVKNNQINKQALQFTGR